MKLIYAKYPGKCQHCGGKTERNEEVWWAPGTGVIHQPCKAEAERAGNPPETQHERSMRDPEYAKGVRDVEDYHFNRDTFGIDYAEAVQMQKEFNEDPY